MNATNQAAQKVRRHTPQNATEGVETMARAGYAAKGAVYIVLGALSLQAAVDGGSAEGSEGAVYAIAGQPFGAVLFVLLSIGLAGYALWRGVQAVLDPEHEGTDAKALLKRGGYAFSGLSHIGLCVVSVQLVIGAGGGGGGQTKQSFLADMMSYGIGQFVVGVFGLLVIGVGLHQLYKAKTTKFRKELKMAEMSPSIRSVAIWSGRIGLAARGVVFPIMGVYLIKAAITASASQAKGVGGALREISTSPFGTIMLAVVASGLVAYGCYQLVSARYRKIQAPS